MLVEFDADHGLWHKTVRDAVAKQCPPSLVRSVAEDGVDPSPLWKSYVDQGWTELNDPDSAVELAIILEEMARATVRTPCRRPIRPARVGCRGVRRGCGAP